MRASALAVGGCLLLAGGACVGGDGADPPPRILALLPDSSQHSPEKFHLAARQADFLRALAGSRDSAAQYMSFGFRIVDLADSLPRQGIRHPYFNALATGIPAEYGVAETMNVNIRSPSAVVLVRHPKARPTRTIWGWDGETWTARAMVLNMSDRQLRALYGPLF